MRLPPQAARAEWFACHCGIWMACAPMPPCDSGIPDEPPALHAATASAATNGATSFKRPFIKAPFLRMVWQLSDLPLGAIATSRLYERFGLDVCSRWLRFECHRFAGAWVPKRQSPCMQRLPRKVEARFNLSIDRIVENGMTDRRQVHANLMRSPGFEAEEQLRMLRKGFAQLVMRHRRFSLVDDRELQTIAWIASDRPLDRAQ